MNVQPTIRATVVEGPAPKWITNAAGMELVLIPHGAFKMGSPRNEPDRNADEQEHDVEITQDFYLGKYPVTVGQFRQFVQDLPYHGGREYRTEVVRNGQGGWGYNKTKRKLEGPDPQYTWKNTGWEQSDSHPVVNVTWNDANAFCKWLSDREHKQYRLPTEAEWEYGCRAGTTTRFYSGDEEESLKLVANLADASLKAKLGREYVEDLAFQSWDDRQPFTAPVGQFKTNDYGLHDMHGNVWQWCQDCYDRNYYQRSPPKDPPGPDRGVDAPRVIRGGSWDRTAPFCRAACRSSRAPAGPGSGVGFRMVREH